MKAVVQALWLVMISIGDLLDLFVAEGIRLDNDVRWSSHTVFDRHSPWIRWPLFFLTVHAVRIFHLSFPTPELRKSPCAVAHAHRVEHPALRLDRLAVGR